MHHSWAGLYSLARRDFNAFDKVGTVSSCECKKKKISEIEHTINMHWLINTLPLTIHETGANRELLPPTHRLLE